MKRIEVVAAIIRKGNKVFATLRRCSELKTAGEQGQSQNGLSDAEQEQARQEGKAGWEFPGGKIEAGERPFHLTMHCYLCSLLSEALHLNEHEAAKWLTKDELDSVKWLPADMEAVERIKEWG